MKISKFAHIFCLAVIIAINVLGVIYILTTGLGRDVSFQRIYLYAVAIQMGAEIFILETFECLWVYRFTPRLISRELNEAIVIINNAVEDAFLQYDDDEDINVPEYFYISTKLAQHFPFLFESSMVLAHQTGSLRHFSKKWKRYLGESSRFRMPEDVSDAARMAYLGFQRYTLFSGLWYVCLLIGTFPIVFQRVCARMIELGVIVLGCTCYYFRKDIPYWCYAILAVILLHEAIALWLRFKEEKRGVQIHDSSMNRRQKKIKPKSVAPLTPSPSKKKKSPNRKKSPKPPTSPGPSQIAPYESEGASATSPTNLPPPTRAGLLTPLENAESTIMSPPDSMHVEHGTLLRPIHTDDSDDSKRMSAKHSVRTGENTPNRSTDAMDSPGVRRSTSFNKSKLPPIQPNIARQLQFESAPTPSMGIDAPDPTRKTSIVQRTIDEVSGEGAIPAFSPRGDDDDDDGDVGDNHGLLESSDEVVGVIENVQYQQQEDGDDDNDGDDDQPGVEDEHKAQEEDNFQEASDNEMAQISTVPKPPNVTLYRDLSESGSDDGNNKEPDDGADEKGLLPATKGGDTQIDRGDKENEGSEQAGSPLRQSLMPEASEEEIEQADAVFNAIDQCLRTLRHNRGLGVDYDDTTLSHDSEHSSSIDDVLAIPGLVVAYSESEESGVNEAIDDCLYLDDVDQQDHNDQEQTNGEAQVKRTQEEETSVGDGKDAKVPAE